MPRTRTSSSALMVVCGALAALAWPCAEVMARDATPDARTEACLVMAAHRHGVDPWLLAAVARTESGFKPTAINVNGNGSTDYGLMQINDIWTGRLAAQGIGRASLADPCVSAYVGAWILSGYIRTHGDVWKGVSAYNTGRPSRGMGYAAYISRQSSPPSSGMPALYSTAATAISRLESSPLIWFPCASSSFGRIIESGSFECSRPNRWPIS